MTFDVEVVLKGRDFAVTDTIAVDHGEPPTWSDAACREVLVEILRAIDRAEHPDADRNRSVVLQGFSWIVEPSDGKVVIAVEIPMGAAVAGPFAIGVDELTAQITRVVRSERQAFSTGTIH